MLLDNIIIKFKLDNASWTFWNIKLPNSIKKYTFYILIKNGLCNLG